MASRSLWALLFSITCWSQTVDALFFEGRVRPVLAAKCYSCHGADRQFSDLRLDSREAIVKGGQRGPAADLIRAAIRHEGPLKMPPAGKLTADEIAAIDQWIGKGFPWPNMKPVAEKKAPH